MSGERGIYNRDVLLRFLASVNRSEVQEMTSEHVFVDGVECKKCGRCDEVKPITEFRRCGRYNDGLDYRCKSCCRETSQIYCKNNPEKCSKTHKAYLRCVKNPACPRVGNKGAKFETFTCEVCGKEFRRLKSITDWLCEHKGYLPHYCSRECFHTSRCKSYKSPYAKDIERIKKEVGA